MANPARETAGLHAPVFHRNVHWIPRLVLAMNAKLIVEFTMSNVCSRGDLDENFTLGCMVRKLCKEDGLFGLVDGEGRILSVEEIPSDE